LPTGRVVRRVSHDDVMGYLRRRPWHQPDDVKRLDDRCTGERQADDPASNRRQTPRRGDRQFVELLGQESCPFREPHVLFIGR